MITKENIHDVLSYHAPDQKGLDGIAKLREAAEVFAVAILENTVPCADQQAALRKVREALMTGNAAIVLGGKG